MGYGDLCGLVFTWFIYNKSMLGFIRTPSININPHKSKHGYVINETGENKSPKSHSALIVTLNVQVLTSSIIENVIRLSI